MARSTDGSASNGLHTASNDFAATSVYTVAGWLNLGDTTDIQSIWGRDDSTSSATRHMQFRSNGTSLEFICFNTAAGTTSATQTGLSSSSGWQHVAGVFTSAKKATAYVDGSPGTESAALSGTPQTGSTRDALLVRYRTGGATPWNEPMNGAVAWMAYWDVALSAADISALAAGAHPLTIQPHNISRLYPLFGGSTGNDIELINGYVLTQQGTVGTAESPPVSLGGAWPANYTPAAGGGATIPVFHHHYQQMRAS